jgi:Transposase DDE domain
LVAKTRQEDLVRSIKILREKLADGFDFLHVRRQEALWRGVEALMYGARLWLTALGRDMRGPALEKHRIKAADRLLGNSAIHAALPKMYQAVALWLLGRMPRPVLLVDWTGCGPDQFLLRVGVPFGGRSILLHGVVVGRRKLATRSVHVKFLKTLAAILPAHCRPVIVSDAGFFHHWFAHITKLGWDYVGRIRGRYCVTINGEKMPIKKLYQRARQHPSDLGIGEVGANRRDPRRLILSPKPRSKGRRRKTRLGRRGQSGADKNHSRGAKEPWLLATSLTCSARKIVEIYATRMQVEESFRDLKSHRFGWAFCSARSKNPKRIEVLLMIATLASIALSMVGAAAEHRKLERQFQANTVRKRRVLSLITLGRRIIRTGVEIPAHDLRAAFAAVQAALQSANPVYGLLI